MVPIEAAIFDLGNVIAFHDNALMYGALGGRAGLTADAVAAVLAEPALFDGVNRGALDGEGIRREVCRSLGIELPMDEFARLWSCHFTVNTEILPVLERLAGRVKLLLLSNTNALHAAYLRPLLPVLERFDSLLLSHELGLLKPEAGFYQEALRRAGVAAEATAFFDDHLPYVEAARALGIRAFPFHDVPQLTADLRALGLSAGA
jgi:putative hydrolase of the HAD superfamily